MLAQLLGNLKPLFAKLTLNEVVATIMGNALQAPLHGFSR
jgi:hypothetical protein